MYESYPSFPQMEVRDSYQQPQHRMGQNNGAMREISSKPVNRPPQNVYNLPPHNDSGEFYFFWFHFPTSCKKSKNLSTIDYHRSGAVAASSASSAANSSKQAINK